VDKFTGNVKGSTNVGFEGTTEAEILHGYSLVDKETFVEVGRFDACTYSGNYFREETDLWLRMRQRDYRLFYEPSARTYVLKGINQGGQWSNMKGNLSRYEYYVFKNHYVFLRKFYGRRRYVMFPLFILQRMHGRLMDYLNR